MGRPRLKLTYGTRVVEGEIETVRRTMGAGGGDEIEVELGRVQQPQVDVMRAGTSGLSADELVEAGMRALRPVQSVAKSGQDSRHRL